MSEGLRRHQPELVARARTMGKSVLELLNPLALPSEAYTRITRLDLRPPKEKRPLQKVLVRREVSITQGPEKPFPGQIALPGMHELFYVEEIKVPAHLLYP